jgi:tetratricopeptide (TPR) repeat protein
VRLDLSSERPERFWMHALVAAFALDTLELTEGENGVREAQQRRLEHYRWVVLAANEATREGGDVQLFGVLLMDLDLPNIRAAHEWARARSSSDRRALEYLTCLPAASRRVLSDHLTPGEFLDWMALAEESARAIGDDDEARVHRGTVGAALLKKGQLQEALAYCEESVDAATARGDAMGVATALGNCASIRNSMGNHDTALELAHRAEVALGNQHAPDVLLGVIGQQAEALEGLGRISEAEERYEARRNLAWREGELSFYAKALRGLARIKRGRPEDRDEARQMYDEAARVSWDLRDHGGYRGALNGKGVLEIEAGSLDAAEELFWRSLRSAVDDEREGDQARAKMNLGIVYQSRGTWQGYEAAEAAYREALPLAQNWDEPDLLGDVLLNLARLLFHVGRYRDSRTEAVTAAEAYGRAGSAKQSWARDLISEIDNATG